MCSNWHALIDEEVPESQRRFSMVYDGDGDVVAMVDMADNSVAARWSYTPYGGVLTPLTDEAGMNPILFGSMFRDAETGLYWDSQSGNYVSVRASPSPQQNEASRRGSVSRRGDLKYS